MNAGEKSLGDVSTALRRQLGAILLVSLPVVAVFLGVALGLPDVYRSVAVIRLDQSLRGDDRAVDTYADYYIETMASQVFSGQNVRSWVEGLDLYADHPDWSIAQKVSEVRANLRAPVSTTPVLDPISGRQRNVVTGFQITFESRSPTDAHSVTSAATEAFLMENRRSRQARGQEQIDFFEQEAAEYRDEITEVEARLAEFKERNNRQLPEMAQANRSQLDRIERDIEQSQLTVDNLKRERVILQQQLSQIPNTPDETVQELVALEKEYRELTSAGYLETHPRVRTIRNQIDQLSQTVDSEVAIPFLEDDLAEVTAQLAEMRGRYQEDHPEIRRIVQEQKTIEERIAALEDAAGESTISEPRSTNELFVQLSTQIKAIDTQISSLTDWIGELRGKREDYEQVLLATPQVEREYQELERDLANARQLYEENQKRLREAEFAFSLTKGSAGEEFVLAQAASIPRSPSWPPRNAIIALGFMLAATFGVGLGIVRELSSGNVRSSADVLALCGAPPISLVPVLVNRHRRWQRRWLALVFLAGVGVLGVASYVVAASA